MDLNVIPTSQNFMGMSYGEWAIEWDRWLMSENPDAKIRKDILFLRGNLDYRSVGSGKNVPRFMNYRSVFDRTGKKRQAIFKNTAILIPVLTSRYSFGDIYDGKRIYDEIQLREAINKDTDESLKAWALITSLNNGKTKTIVPNINEFRIESPLYKLHIPENSKLAKKMECKPDTGMYDSVIGGFFLIIRYLQEGQYRLLFGGEGRGRYSTSSAYDICVDSAKRDGIKNVSRL